MKKILALVALVALTACGGSYDYYKGDVRYVQDGADCIYSSGEVAHKYSQTVKSADLGKKIVYRNTKCRDLYLRDNFGATPRTERQVLTPTTSKPAPCGCEKKCGKKKYVFVK